jgi:hypothetical protein
MALLFKLLSQINIELNISVAITLIANLLQVKHWKALVAVYKKQIGLQSLNFHLSDILRPKQIQRLLCFDLRCSRPAVISHC